MAKQKSSWLGWVVLLALVGIIGGLMYFGNSWQKGSFQVAVPLTELYEKGPFEANVTEVDYYTGTKGYLAEPNRNDMVFPGVVMIHEWWGLNETIKETARKLATQGYKVLAVDLYGGKVATDAAEAQKFVGGVKPQQAIANMKAAVSFLQKRGISKVASLGWCFGGGQSLALAMSGQKLDATVLYYGTPLVTEPAKLSVIKWPVLGIFGDKDQAIPVDTIYKFEKSLTDLSTTKEIYIYAGLGHAFANPTGPNYAPEATKDAWEKTLVFLKKYLKP